jgi:hypothetical protein
MKLSAIIVGFGSLLFATTNAGAQVGENIAQLEARYGEPGNPVLGQDGMFIWPMAQVYAWLEDGKAVVIQYEYVDGDKRKALLEQNLPSAQTWGNGDSFKDFMRGWSKSDHDRGRVEEMQYWQTADGSRWALYSAETTSLGVGTPEGWKKLFSSWAEK